MSMSAALLSFQLFEMTDVQENADPTAETAAAAAVAAKAAEIDDDGDLDSEADETRSKLENIKYYASLFLGTVRMTPFDFTEERVSRVAMLHR